MWSYRIDRTYPPWSGDGAERQLLAPGVNVQKAHPPPAVLWQALAAFDPANYPTPSQEGRACRNGEILVFQHQTVAVANPEYSCDGGAARGAARPASNPPPSLLDPPDARRYGTSAVAGDSDT